MAIIIVSAILFTILFINLIMSFSTDWRKELISIITVAICGLILGAIAGIGVLLITSTIISSNAEIKTVYTATSEIYALTDNSSAEGSRFLYSGYINEKLVYRYIVETEKGKQVKEIDSENAYIIENDTELPRIEIYEKVYKNDWLNKFFIVFNDEEYIIYIPEGSITTEYNIDLE